MADTGGRNEGETEPISVGEVDVDEVACEAETEDTIAGRAGPAEEDVALTPEEEDELDAMMADAEGMGAGAAAAPGLGALGGGQGGCQKPVDRAVTIARRNGLTITSRKRSSGSSGSDHHVSQHRSDAADMSNGSQPTPEMDKTCRQIATLLGRPGFTAGNLRVTMHGYRVQLLYRTNIGGNHFNHVHLGIRAL